jgi:hypothetical protein
MLFTTRRQIQYPDPNRLDRADIALHLGYIALAADLDVVFNQGTDADRLAAAHQPAGGRFWWTTDTKLLWYDDGAVWSSVAPTSSSSGALSARPAANTLTAGSSFFATDQVADYVTDGSQWIRRTIPAGAVVDWFKPDGAPPVGWVLYDGQNLPAATGIYADLYAHLGNSLTKPDTRGRHTVGLGTHADVNAIGVNDTLAVGARTPKHNSTTSGLTLPAHTHTVSDPGHSHSMGPPAPTALVNTGSPWSIVTGQGGWNSASHTHTINTAYTGISVSGGGGGALNGQVGPGGTRPVDGGAYIVCAKIGKL